MHNLRMRRTSSHHSSDLVTSTDFVIRLNLSVIGRITGELGRALQRTTQSSVAANNHSAHT